ncbi:MAG: tetratricopeptide repeat protein [Chloroflexota bacterium]|nr:tetratricopeptide repeat protein [Chloroflexota bacterium]
MLADNAADAEQVEPLLPGAGGILLVTSRQRFSLDGANGPTDVDLAVLPAVEAEELLQTICPRIGTDAAELARLCGYLPSALEISASLLRASLRPVADYLHLLADATTRLHALRGRGSNNSVEAAFSVSWAALDPAAQATLAQLSVFPAPFAADAAAAVVELPAGAAPLADQLDTLYYRSLLDAAGTPRYRLHDLVRAFAAEQLGSSDAVALRHAQYYVTVAWQADKLYKTKDRMGEGLALFDGERLHIDAGWAWARSRADSDASARVLLDYADATAYIGSLRYHARTERIPQLEAWLAAARRLGRKGAEGAALGNLGLAYAALGEARRAIGYHEQDLAMSSEIGDRRGEGAALGNLGLAYADLGEARRAIVYYEQHLAIAREIGDRRGEGSALSGLGSAYADLGDARRAIVYYEQRIVIAREIGDQRNEGAALGNLGLAYADLGEAQRAIGYYEQHLAIAREIGDRQGEGSALSGLGSSYYLLGEVRRAIGYYEQVLTIMREIGDRRNDGNTLGNLGNAYAVLGEVERAIGYYEQHLAIAREIEDRAGEGTALGNLGVAYSKLGATQQAVGFYDQQLIIVREIGDRGGEANATWNLGLLREKQGDLAQTVALMQVLVDFEREIGHPDAEADAAQVAAVRARLAAGD